MVQWISVEDRLPEYNHGSSVKVLAFDGNREYLARYTFTVQKNADTCEIEKVTGIFNEWFHGITLDEQLDHITHWRYPTKEERF